MTKKANLEAKPHQSAAQLDSAADVHLCGDRKLFTHLQKLEEPIHIEGVNPNSEKLISHQQGTIKFKSSIGGKTSLVSVEEVLYAPSYPGTIISVGTLTDKGCDVITKGRRGNTPGTTKIIKDGKLMLEGTQLPGSKRTFVDFIVDSCDAVGESDVARVRNLNYERKTDSQIDGRN